jgi:MoaE-MoaD fusion protein
MDDASMKPHRLEVLLFHTLRSHAGSPVLHLEIEGPLTGAALWDVLEKAVPGIRVFQPTTRVARNQAYIGGDDLIQPGDEIALIPPVSGG